MLTYADVPLSLRASAVVAKEGDCEGVAGKELGVGLVSALGLV
jgi:hypothetical protein